MRLFGFKLAEAKSVERKYGVIKTSVIKYITPTMIFVVVMCGVLAYLNSEQLYLNYQTNIPLNSLILLLFLFAMVDAFKNNINIYNTARFFKRMEEQIRAPIVSETAIFKLKKMLDTGAYLVNTQNTFKLLENLQKFGHPLITDNDARLIKSKLGFRIRIQRSSVSFMGGLLVMLGLIGTFWGLLLTIASVSDAMDVIAEQASNLGSSEGSGIGGIIKSISEPLQGMGVAFSSSLFGLAGSLVVGFFNYSCAQAQDRAIEDFSRWIDENIPASGSDEEKLLKSSRAGTGYGSGAESAPQKAEKNSDTHVANSTEFLKDDITSQILFTLKQSTVAQNTLSENFEKLLTAQSVIQEILSLQNQQISKLDETNEQTNQRMDVLSDYSKQNVDASLNISLANEKLVHQSEEINTKLAKENHVLENGMGMLHTRLAELENAVVGTHGYFDDVKMLLSEEKEFQEKLLYEVDSIKGKIPQNEYEMLRVSCANISQSIGEMERSLKDNVKIMKEVAREGNLARMSRILKEMQLFWLQMKQNAFDIVKKDNRKED